MAADKLFLTLALTLPPLAAGAPRAAAHEPRAPHAAAEEEEPLELTLEQLIDARYVPGEDLDPDIVDEYDGQRVSITGLMALGTLEGQEDFELVSDACGCGQSKVNHFVKVLLVDDLTRFMPDEITVTGKFEASEELDEDGWVTSVWRLTADSITE